MLLMIFSNSEDSFLNALSNGWEFAISISSTGSPSILKIPLNRSKGS